MLECNQLLVLGDVGMQPTLVMTLPPGRSPICEIGTWMMMMMLTLFAVIPINGPQSLHVLK